MMKNEHALNSSKPRLLVITSTYPRWRDDTEPGFVHELCARLTQEFNVLVLCPHSPQASTLETIEGVEIRRFHYAPVKFETLIPNGGILSNLKSSPWKWVLVPLFLCALVSATYRAIKNFRPHAIHCHWIIPQGIALWILSLIKKGTPTLITSHGGDLFSFNGKIGRWLKKKAINNATSLTIVSESMKDEALKLGARHGKVYIAPMGVGFPSEPLSPPPARVPGRILFVGRLVEKKGLIHLLSTLPEIILHCPNTHLVIAGDGPERGFLERQAAEMGVADRVQFLGAVSHNKLPCLYQEASLFCAPFIRAKSGDMEGLGLVTLEAIYFGTPVLVGNVPAIYDVISKDFFSSCVMNPKDHQALAMAIRKSLTQPLPQESMNRLRAQIMEKFSWQTVGRRYSKILSETISSDEGKGSIT